MSAIDAFVSAVALATPILEELAIYLQGGEFPPSLVNLPEVAKSRIMLEAMRERERLAQK